MENIQQLLYLKKDKFLLKVIGIFLAWLYINTAYLFLTGIEYVFIYGIIIYLSTYRKPIYSFIIVVLSIFSNFLFSGSFFGANLGDDFSLDISTDIMNGGAVACLIQLFQQNKIKRRYFTSSIGVSLLLYLIFVVFHSCVFSQNKEVSITQLPRILSFFLFYIMTVAALNNLGNYYVLLKFMLYFSLLFIFIVPLKLIFSPNEVYYGGSFLILSIPLLNQLYVQRLKKIYWSHLLDKSLLVLSHLFSCMSLFLTISRRSTIAVIIYNLFFFESLGRRLFLIALMAGFVTYSILTNFLPERLRTRLELTSEAITEYQEFGNISEYKSQFFNQRDLLTAAGWDIFSENMVLGTGFYNTTELMENYIGEKIRVHNFYLQILGDFGIFGLLFYLIILVQLITILFYIRKIRFNDGSDFFRLQAKSLLIYLFVISIMAYFGMHILYGKFEWMVFGIIAALYNLANQKKYAL